MREYESRSHAFGIALGSMRERSFYAVVSELLASVESEQSDRRRQSLERTDVKLNDLSTIGKSER